MNLMTVSLWFLYAFISGALPLSVWLGRLALGVDIRQYGDGNPGAANVWRAGGARWGVLAILLDAFKGAIPVGLVNHISNLDGLALAVIALAPILGHALSPFLRFRGGKALAVTFGVWTGLTLWLAPSILGGLFALGLFLLAVEGWAVVIGSAGLLLILWALGSDAAWLWVAGGSLLIFAWTHHRDLRQPPRLR
jgi:glycerol-3-phosphate acyltransferase PlsY